ncbi:MAG TPA: serine/threonine-protein kinase [Polyangiaceae bacterium]|jgi:serine/threonine-protein kinase|nr:serine/threonine-protein kinase [Polyangiaceae bacterium]
MLQPGQIIQDKYRIVRMIGQGGMGEVYEGENISIARRVAIKVLLGEAALNADIVQRFEREAQAAGRIGNDHILEVLDLGALPTGDRFMVMEFLDGEPLNSRIERLRQLTPEQVIPLVLQALAGLAAAHQAGIIHRDLKPENLFVLKQKAGTADYVKIIDFGISKFSQLSNEGMKMTKTGSVMGTPYYMSPEQANGSREADARSDLYAMGVILYECVTGAVPFDGKTFNELLFKIVLSDPVPPRQLAPNLDPAFEPIILKAMAREIEQRFQTCDEFAQALRDYQAGRGMQMADVTGPMPAFNVAQSAQTANAAGARGLATGANWSKTDGQIPTPIPKTSTGLVVAIAAGGLLVLGGGALAAVKVMHSGSAPTPSASIAEKPTSEPAPSATAPTTASATATAPATTEAPPTASNNAPAKLSVVPPKPGIAHPPPKAHPPPPKKGGGGSSKPSGPDFGY